jgi:hypothetical protein
VTLLNNGSNSTSISANGSFTFSTAIAEGSTYAVTVGTQPTDQTCTVANGSGTMGGGNVTNVSVTCSTNTYTVGGSISGLTGTVTLLNNSTNSTPISANGSFNFSTAIAEGSTYAVTVGTQPTEQTCTVTNGTGTMGGANVTNVSVTCVTNNTTLSVSATGTIPVYTGTPGTPGTLTVTNTGATYPAYNVSASLPGGWIGVTQTATCADCGTGATSCTEIPPGGTCTLSFTSTTPYVAQGSITVTGDNITTPPTTALAFTAQGYLIWQVSGSTVWVIDTADLSQTTWGSGGGTISSAQSLTNGAGNTTAIVAAIGTGSTYAALECNQSTNGGAAAGAWYLPAICEMGASATQAGCSSGTATIDVNLNQYGFGGLVNRHWSSTQNASYATGAWYELFNYAGVGSEELWIWDTTVYPVRCAQALTL